MADTGIDAVKKQKNAEYAKRYRLKRKLLMQQQTSASSEPNKVNVYLPSLVMKVPDHLYVLGDTYTCHISFLCVSVVLY